MEVNQHENNIGEIQQAVRHELDLASEVRHKRPRLDDNRRGCANAEEIRGRCAGDILAREIQQGGQKP